MAAAIPSLSPLLFFFIALFIPLFLLHLLPPSYCLHTHYPHQSTQDLVVEEKTRLGSTPPSCHNKCNQCHPCMAVQVPTLPSHSGGGGARAKPVDYFDPPRANRYSNYKPLGWKCRCGDHFYNP